MVSCGVSCVDVHKCLVHNTPQQATIQDSCEEGRRCPRTSEGQHVEDLFVRRLGADDAELFQCMGHILEQDLSHCGG